MKSLIQKLAIAFGVLVLGSAFVFAPVTSAQTKDDICQGVAFATGEGCGDQTGADAGIAGLAADVINILSIIVGIVAVIMIIIGGFKYIISAGDANNVNSAKNTILYAIVGLVVVALAQVIVRFVLNRVA